MTVILMVLASMVLITQGCGSNYLMTAAVSQTPRLVNTAVPTAVPATPTATMTAIPVNTATPTFTATPAITFTPTFTGTPTPIPVVDSSNFTQVVLNSPIPVMVDCSASWCGWCTLFAPVAAQFAQDYAGKVMVVKLDCSSGSIIANSYGIGIYPTSLFFVNGKLVT